MAEIITGCPDLELLMLAKAHVPEVEWELGPNDDEYAIVRSSTKVEILVERAGWVTHKDLMKDALIADGVLDQARATPLPTGAEPKEID